MTSRLDQQTLFLQCADILESSPCLLRIGWNLREAISTRYRFYAFDRAINLGDENCFWTLQYDSSKNAVMLSVKYSYWQSSLWTIKNVNHFENTLQKVNDDFYNPNGLQDAASAMTQLKTLFDASLLQKHFFHRGARLCDGDTALVMDVHRIYDTSEIRIGFEQRISIEKRMYHTERDRLNYYYVTCTTEAEMESGQLIRLPIIDKRGITNPVAALQAAVLMRQSLLDVPDIPRRQMSARLKSIELPGSTYVPRKSARDLKHAFDEFAIKNKEFGTYFTSHGIGYTTNTLLQPYVCISLEPDVDQQKFKVNYQIGEGASPDSAKTTEFWEIESEIAKKALCLINTLTRRGVDTEDKIKICLDSMLKPRKKNLSYTPNKMKTGADVKIRNGKASAQIRHKPKLDSPFFTCKLTYKGEDKKYKCYHPSHVVWVIDATIEDIEWEKK